MDPHFSKEKRCDRFHQDPEGFHMYMNETHTTKDIKKKKIKYKKGPATDDDFPTSSAFQIPEKDKTRYLPLQEESFRKLSKNKYFDQPEKLRDSSKTRTRDLSPEPTLRYDQDVNYLSRGRQYDRNIPSRNGVDDTRGMRTQSVERERVTNQVNYAPSPFAYTNYQETTRSMSEKPQGPEINPNPSLICRAINNDGESVVVNDEVIKDKLILSCRPRSYYGPPVYLKKTTDTDSGRIPKYVYPPPDVSVVENININKTTDIDIQQKQKRLIESDYDNGRQKSSLVRSNAYDLGSLGLGDQGLQKETQEEKYEEQYRVMQCKRYRRTFKNFLWALFTINLLLLLVGITLLLLALWRILFYPYINTVIGHVGFSTWIWAVLGLSLIIILVAVYGMASALTRVRRMLLIYCFLALTLAVVILIFLLMFWLTSHSLQQSVETGMKNTFHMYRCHRWVRVAWDNLHENFECCGIEARGDWKYIPPSCCHAENKYQKVKCIGHFITEEQAYKKGCRSLIVDDFTTVFLLITCLLVLAIILLLLGILAAMRLLKMYKVIRLCRDMYLITR